VTGGGDEGRCGLCRRRIFVSALDWLLARFGSLFAPVTLAVLRSCPVCLALAVIVIVAPASRSNVPSEQLEEAKSWVAA